MASTPTSILLTNGTLLLHDASNHITPTRADLLIEGPHIARIARTIDPSPTTRIINCAHKLVSPGFINTHAHLWQTQLKGRHSAHTLVEYMPPGAYVGSSSAFFTPADVFWGELAGALENVDAGTTTVLDHAHVNHSAAALRGLRTSGLRAVYAYAPPRRFELPATLEEGDPLESLEEWRGLQQRQQQQHGRVSMGFALDSVYAPPEKLSAIYAALRDGDGAAKVITTHSTNGRATVSLLNAAGVLGRDVVLSHAPGLTESDAAVLGAAGAGVSSTPNTEMQMGMEPVALRFRDSDMGRSLGTDCHTWGTCYMPTQMTLCLQEKRLARAREVSAGGKWLRRIEGTVEEVFNLGTLGGAQAVGMEGQLGSLKEGWLADIAVFDATSPGMLAAAVQDPVAAIVLHSSVRDVQTVIVDGVVRKEGGRLCDVRVEEEGVSSNEGVDVETGTTLSWVKVANEVLKSRVAVEARIGGVDFGPAEEAVIDAWHMNRDDMVER